MGYRRTFKQDTNDPLHNTAKYRLINFIRFKLTISVLQKQLFFFSKATFKKREKEATDLEKLFDKHYNKEIISTRLYKDTYKSTRGSNIIEKNEQYICIDIF